MTKAEKYKLTKEMLFVKFNGVCAFCGHDLGERWCIWEIEPSKTIVTYRGDIILGNESYDNKLPACISCNSTRIHNSTCKELKIDIENFRKALLREFDFFRFHSMTETYYRKAIKYGLLKETGNEIVFHFEKHQ